MSSDNDIDQQEKSLARNPELMSRTDTVLLVVDMQEKLMAVIPDAKRITWNARRLVEGAVALGMPVLATEQYPEGLGPTTLELANLLERPFPKKVFSCGLCTELMEALEKSGASKVLLAGVESHVCIQQTAFDLLGAGYRVFLASDAISSRSDDDHRIALGRMDSGGAVITTTEAALFEWCETAAASEFKTISSLVRTEPPARGL